MKATQVVDRNNGGAVTVWILNRLVVVDGEPFSPDKARELAALLVTAADETEGVTSAPVRTEAEIRESIAGELEMLTTYNRAYPHVGLDWALHVARDGLTDRQRQTFERQAAMREK